MDGHKITPFKYGPGPTLSPGCSPDFLSLPSPDLPAEKMQLFGEAASRDLRIWPGQSGSLLLSELLTWPLGIEHNHLQTSLGNAAYKDQDKPTRIPGVTQRDRPGRNRGHMTIKSHKKA